MSTFIWRTRERILALLLGATTLSGCLPSLDTEDRDQTIIVAKAFPPLSLDPAVYATANDYPVQELVYEQLLKLDPSQPDGVAPELAASWSVAEDRLSIAFSLDTGRVFASGHPIDADAVAFSLVRTKEIGRWSSGYLEWMDTVVVTGDHTFEIRLNKPYYPALALLAQAATSIVDPSLVIPNQQDDRGIGYLSANSAGSGPYVIERLTVDGSVILKPNPRAAAPAQFKRVEFRAIPDEGVRRLLLERGDVDFTDIVPAAFLNRYQELPGVDVLIGEGGTSLSFLTLNTRNGPFSDPNIRQAAYHSIDYRGLRELVLKGNAVQIPGYLPPFAAGYDKAEPLPERDLDRARQLLELAEYDGEPVEFVTTLVGPVGEFIQSNLKDAGLNVKIVRRDPGSIDAVKRNGDFGLVYEGWLMDSADPTTMLEALFSSKNIGSGLNPSGYNDPETDRLIERLIISQNQEERTRLLKSIDERLRDARPVIMIFSAMPIAAYRDDLLGIKIDPLKPYLHRYDVIERSERSEEVQ